MVALTSIQIRKISNGYVVSAQIAPETLGYPISGGHERFYPSLDEMSADAQTLIQESIQNAESAITEHNSRLEVENAQMMKQGYACNAIGARF